MVFPRGVEPSSDPHISPSPLSPPLSGFPLTVNFKVTGEQVREFTFHRVLGPECRQEEVYRQTAQPLVDALWMGQSGLLFAYGVTNAGKTYTIMGKEGDAGVLPRALQDLFARVEREEAGRREAVGEGGGIVRRVVCSYLEIYNEQIYDLLSGEGGGEGGRGWSRVGQREGKASKYGAHCHILVFLRFPDRKSVV